MRLCKTARWALMVSPFLNKTVGYYAIWIAILQESTCVYHAGMKERRVAIFDVDGTIFRSSLLIQIVRVLIERKAFPVAAREVYEREYQRWLDREGDYQEYIEAVIRAFRTHLKGVHYAELADASEQLVEEQWKRTYRYTRDLLKELREKDYYLLAVSHSPKTVLDKFCPRLGFDKSYGIVYEIGPQDLFTGAISEEHLILNKANVVRRAIEKADLTLEGSIGVGDTESDIPFLEMVAHPICFNPNARLYKTAQRLGWDVKVERKDVVYDI
jgi:HAD superfamily hydrolase (TIGR01490 family)